MLGSSRYVIPQLYAIAWEGVKHYLEYPAYAQSNSATIGIACVRTCVTNACVRVFLTNVSIQSFCDSSTWATPLKMRILGLQKLNKNEFVNCSRVSDKTCHQQQQVPVRAGRLQVRHNLQGT